VSGVLDASEREGPKARNVVGVGKSVKSVDAVRGLECDFHARFGHDGVKVAFKRMLHRTSASALCCRWRKRRKLN